MTENKERKEKIERKLEKAADEQKNISTNIDKLRKKLSSQKVRMFVFSVCIPYKIATLSTQIPLALLS